MKKYIKNFNEHNTNKTYRDIGFYITDERDGKILVDEPDKFKFGSPMIFDTIEEANNFLDTKVYDEESVYQFRIKDLIDPDGKYAIYKRGGFSGNMTDENLHKKWGWHIMNFKNKSDAIKYMHLGNITLQLHNGGGGYYVMHEDDGTTIPKSSQKMNNH